MAENPNESANDQIADELTTHTINILRVAADMQRPVLAELVRLEASLSAEVAALPQDISIAKSARLNALFKQTTASIQAAYQKIDTNVQDGLAKVAAVEQAKATSVVNKGVGASVMTVASTAEQLQSIASGILIKGRFPRQYWADQDQRLRGNFEAAMRDGIARGEGVDALVQRVRGTKKANYSDGIMFVPKYQAEALVRTAVQSASNQARLLSFEKNTDVIKAVQWRSTLDDRTTEICLNLNGKQWTLPGYKPIDHDITFPGPIAHWNCRSTQVAVTKSWAELAKPKAIDPPDGPPSDIETLVRDKADDQGKTEAQANAIVEKQKDIVDGQPTDVENINEYLNRKPPEFQNALLGPQRAELFRQGKIKIADLLDQKDRPLSVDTLKKMVENGHSVPVATFKEGEGGLGLAERSLLNESHTAGAQHGQVLGHFMDATTGATIDFEGTTPTPDDIAKASKFKQLVYLRNGLAKGEVFTPQEINLFGSLPNFQTARLVTPTGRVISLNVKKNQTFTPADAIAVNTKMAALKNTPNMGLAAKLAKAAGSKDIPSISFRDHGTGTIQPPPPTDIDAAMAAQKKAEADAAAQLAAKEAAQQAAEDAAQAQAKAEQDAQAAKAKSEADAAKAEELKQQAQAEADRQEAAQTQIDDAQKKSDPLSLALVEISDRHEGTLNPTEIVAAAKAKVQADKVAAQDKAAALAAAKKQADEQAAVAKAVADQKAAEAEAVLKKQQEEQEAAEAKAKADAAVAKKKADDDAAEAVALALKQQEEAAQKAADDAKATADKEASDYKAATKGCIAAFGPGSPASVAPINGIPFTTPKPEYWLDHKTVAFPDEPAIPKIPKGKEFSTGVIFVEDDGSLWLYSPTKNFGGYKNTLSKGRLEPDLSPQQNALKEAYEELGLTGTIEGCLGDFQRSETTTRFYVGKRTGGEPWTANLNGETDYVKLATPDQASALFNRKYDREVLAKLKDYLHPPLAPEPTIAPADVDPHLRANQAVGDGFPADPSKLRKIGSVGGTTGAYLAEDPATGEKFVVKKGGGPDPENHLREESMTDAIYRGMGLAVPDEHLYETPSGPVKVTRYLDNSKDLSSYLKTADVAEKKSVLDKIRSGFAVDALLGNWDVLGASMDNIRVSADGTPYRIDNGGGLRYRAQGTVKTADQWNGAPVELWSLRKQEWAPKGIAVIPGNISTFGKLSIVDIAKQIDGINQATFEKAINESGVPADVKATLLQRMSTMRVIAAKAEEMEDWDFRDTHTEDITREMVNLRQIGAVERLPQKLVQSGNTPGETVQILDENGKLFDELRSNTGTARKATLTPTPSGPATMFSSSFDKILQGIKTVNYHSKVGDAAYNQSKVDAALAQESALEDVLDHSTSTASQKAAAKSYLDALEKLKAAVTLGKSGNFAEAGKQIPTFDPVKETPSKSATPTPATPKPIVSTRKDSIVNQVSEYLDANGGSSDLVSQWMQAQGGSSWSQVSRAYKFFLDSRMDVADSDIFWGSKGSTSAKSIAESAYNTLVTKYGAEVVAKSFTVWHAFTQEILGNTTFRFNDQDRKAVRIIRTERQEVMAMYNLITTSTKTGRPVRNFGQALTIPRGLNESGSIFHDAYPSGNTEVTVQAVPHCRVTGVYFTEKPPAQGGSGFLGDGENEFTFIASGVPFDYTGTQGKIGISLDGGTDASAWNIPIAHLEDSP